MVEKFTKNELEVYGHLKVCAIEQDWVLNSDKESLYKLVRALAKNRDNFGFVYCPCRIKHTPENICPCDASHDEIHENGKCLCKLFYRKGNKDNAEKNESH